MLTMQVALVPLRQEQAPGAITELLQVASALQTQVLRDFGPVWDVSAVVSPFLDLEEVPPEYLPLIIVDSDLPEHHHGFHLAMDGRPFGLVHRSPGWSVVASHELLEMICDPTGGRTKPGPSLKDDPVGPGQRLQGMVDYLVEVCDPCEASKSYDIDGVAVSDFVTPQYYDTFLAKGQRYSFLGSITQPRGVLPGGYISWRTREPRNGIWQAFNDDGQLKIDRLRDVRAANDHSPLHSRFARHSIAFDGKRLRAPAPDARSVEPDESWARYGKAFRDDVYKLMRLLGRPKPVPSIRDIIALLEDARNGKVPQAELAKFDIPAFGHVDDVDPHTMYDRILKALRQQQELSALFGDMLDPDLASWLCYLMP